MRKPLVTTPHIVFVNQSAGYLMIDIIHAFGGHSTGRTLMAGFVNPRNHPLDADVEVVRIIPYDRSSTVRRLFTWGWGFLQLLWHIQTRYRGAHLFLVSNPPMATLLPLLCRNSYSLLVYDVYPDALAEYRIFSEGHPLIKWWKNANRKIYGKADHIFTLSEGMRQLMGQYTSPERITVVPVWTDNTFLQPIPKGENPFLAAQGLQDKFVVMYSGNLGKTHELSILVDLAADLEQADVFFLLIGGGDQYKALEERIAQCGLSNIRLLPWQPTDQLPYTLAAADIGVVSLGKEASRLSMPSKTFNLLSVGCPILGIADAASALGQLIHTHQIGACHAPHERQQMRDFILGLRQNASLHQQYRDNALQASLHYGPENAARFVSQVS
jgi:hypothetical protein